MTKLSIEQMLYLLYTVAYSNEGTVTQGTVKEHLSKELKKNADGIYNTLYQQNLLESPKRRRISVTEEGRKALVANLQTTDYEFDSSKGQKVLNTLLHCLKLTSLKDYVSSVPIEDMDFDTFVEKFKELYFAERKQQELRGVVAIYSRDIGLKFRDNHPISQSTLDNYFNTLKLTGKVFAVTEKEEEIIQWVE
ncbi:winged helix-turn-helix domain-containing protein [Nostoc sp. CHAB 5784]|uniref:winged helix-turn-helix domain-containing protein n=1 Tax=Nostoc mirabile TaxID=2907820 RepID=UPI001E483367|nr:winged helix-turn-helix domain-containing protein [Nostoc mirabile]MCC5667353.1 winged helix-turn-helix domain-containing protein [Nostoc mirabile CHAB5784]